MNWQHLQIGRIVDHGTERHQRITRINRAGMRLHYSAAVTDAERDGCKPPSSDQERILGFVVQLVDEDLDCDRICFPSRGFFAPGDAVAISLNERIWALTPCDVRPGDHVVVHPISGLPAARGIEVLGATWESLAMGGELAVIQINTRAVMPWV